MSRTVHRDALRLAVRDDAPVTPVEPAPSDVTAPAEAPASRVRSFVASDETVDRYNTVIKASGWQLDNFKRNPVILFGHNSRDWPIGKGRAWVDGTQLRLDVDFFPADVSPAAEQALRMLDLGVMGVSVGFNPLEYVYNEERESEDSWENLFNPPLDYTRQDLLEVSVVTIGANPAAVPVGRELVQQRMTPLERVVTPTTKIPVPALARLVPDLVREAVAEVAAEIRASRARRAGRIS